MVLDSNGVSRSLSILGAFALCAGCSGSELLFLSYPETEGYQTLVLAVQDGSRLQLAAIDISAGRFPVRLPGPLEVDVDWQAHALLFHDDLASLKLAEGSLTESTEDDLYPILLEPDQLLAQSSDDAVLGTWQPVTSVPSRFHPLRIHNDDPFGFCPEVDLVQVELPDTRGDARFALSLAPDRIFLLVARLMDEVTVVEEQKAFIIDLDGESLRVRELVIAPEPPLRAAAIAPDGTIWVADFDGRLHELEVGETEVTTSLIADSPAESALLPLWLHVDSEVIVSMGTSGLVYGGFRAQNSSVVWQREALYDFAYTGPLNAFSGAILARPNGELWLGRGNTKDIVRLRHRDGRFLAAEIDDGLRAEPAIGISALEHIDGIGVLAGMNDGEISRFDETTEVWRSLGPTRFTQVVHCIVPARRGFMMLGGTGLFNFYVDPEGYCPLDVQGYKGLRTLNTIRVAEPLGDGYLSTGATLAGSSQAVTWIRPKL